MTPVLTMSLSKKVGDLCCDGATDEWRAVQAMQRAGLCGSHSPTRLLILSPCTLGDVLQSILEVGLSSSWPALTSSKVCSYTGVSHKSNCRMKVSEVHYIAEMAEA